MLPVNSFHLMASFSRKLTRKTTISSMCQKLHKKRKREILKELSKHSSTYSQKRKFLGEWYDFCHVFAYGIGQKYSRQDAWYVSKVWWFVFIWADLAVLFLSQNIYRTRTIITSGLYIFHPLFKAHLCTVTFGPVYG